MAKKSGSRNAVKAKVPKQRAQSGAAGSYDEQDRYARSPGRRAAGGSSRKAGAGPSPGSGKRVQKTRRRSPLWAKVTVAIGALLILTSGVSFAGIKTVTGQVEDSFQTSDLLGDAGKSEARGGKNLDGAIDMLLLGIDVRESWEDKNNTRADSILVLHIPSSHDQAYLMSLPRDAKVDIPKWPASKWPGGREKINEAFFWGAANGGGWNNGMALTANTVTKLTGITFDGAATIDFGGFERIINTLGTVDMCIEADATSLHYYHVNGKPTYVNEHVAAGKGYKPFVHKQGCRELPGWEALDYSRIRYSLPDGDYGRQRHQQQLIKAMAKKAGSAGTLTDLNKVSALLAAAGETMKLDTNGIDLTDFMFTMKDLAGADLVLLKTNAGFFNPTAAGDAEALDVETIEMFRAARDDRLGQFLLENPSLVNNDG